MIEILLKIAQNIVTFALSVNCYFEFLSLVTTSSLDPSFPLCLKDRPILFSSRAVEIVQ